MVYDIDKILFNNPVTVIFWADGTKTYAKIHKGSGDVYSKETGVAICLAKKVFGASTIRRLFRSINENSEQAG